MSVRRPARPRRRPAFVPLSAILAGLILLLAACGGGDDEAAPPGEQTAPEGEAPTGEPILIGAVKALSGFMVSFDQPPLRGAELAVEDINDAGGVLGRPLEIITCDYHSKVEDSAPCATELLGKGAEFILAACDFDFGSPAAQTAQAQGVLAFSDCAGSVQFGVQVIGPLAYTMGNSGRSEGAVMAEWAFEEKQWKTAWTLRDTGLLYYNEVCTGFKDRFTELGGTIVGEETFTAEDPSVASQINSLRGIQPEPESLFICGFPTGGSAAIRQIRAAGFEQPLMSSNTYDGDYWKEAIPPRALSNVFFANYASLEGDDPNPDVNEFMARYTERWSKPDNSNLVTGYSVMQLFKIAVEEAGTTDGAQLAETIDNLGQVDLLVGPTTFTSELHIDLARRQEIMQIQDGKTSFLEYWELSEPPKVDF